MKYVESILRSFKIQPFGTVGRYAAAPVNPTVHMRQQIAKADFIVICATPRYIQTEVKTGKITHGISEMVQVEAGMVYASNKPVVVFAQQGTSTGGFLPNITQYITLSCTRDDQQYVKLIGSLLSNASKIAYSQKFKKGAKIAGGIAVGGLAAYGTL